MLIGGHWGLTKKDAFVLFLMSKKIYGSVKAVIRRFLDVLNSRENVCSYLNFRCLSKNLSEHCYNNALTIDGCHRWLMVNSILRCVPE